MPSATGIFTRRESEQNALDEPLAAAIVVMFPDIISAADMGSGTGHYCEYFHSHGWPIVHGYDGTLFNKTAYQRVFCHDLTNPEMKNEHGFPYEFILCLETAEHIPKELEVNFLKNISRFAAPQAYLVFSWAVPGQGGTGHINEVATSEAIGKFETVGFEWDAAKSYSLQESAVMPWRKNIHVMRKRRGHV